jgi:hypothetical protein
MKNKKNHFSRKASNHKLPTESRCTIVGISNDVQLIGFGKANEMESPTKKRSKAALMLSREL